MSGLINCEFIHCAFNLKKGVYKSRVSEKERNYRNGVQILMIPDRYLGLFPVKEEKVDVRSL